MERGEGSDALLRKGGSQKTTQRFLCVKKLFSHKTPFWAGVFFLPHFLPLFFSLSVSCGGQFTACTRRKIKEFAILSSQLRWLECPSFFFFSSSGMQIALRTSPRPPQNGVQAAEFFPLSLPFLGKEKEEQAKEVLLPLQATRDPQHRHLLREGEEKEKQQTREVWKRHWNSTHTHTKKNTRAVGRTDLYKAGGILNWPSPSVAGVKALGLGSGRGAS